MLTLILPYPVSANRYWRPVRIGQHITIVPTKEAKEYRKEVAWLCAAGGIRKPLEGRLRVEIDLYPHRPIDWEKRIRKLGPLWDDGVQCIDLGNCEKVLSDAMNGVVWVDDKQIWEMPLRRMTPDAGAERVVVRVSARIPEEIDTP